MNKEIDIFLLIGQSNMSGRGDIKEVPALNHPNILMFRQKQWIPAVEPLHTDKEWAGIGLGMSFAFELTKHYPESKIGLVPCAVGGTPLSRWSPGGDLYINAVDIAKQALKDGILKGILWHQGESDSSNQNDAITYGDRFISMVNGLRKDLADYKVPVLAGELGEFLSEHEGLNYFQMVNEHFHKVIEKLQPYRCVSSAGLKDKGDKVHFNALALREFGKRYAKEYMDFESKT